MSWTCFLLDRLCPLHAELDADGLVRRAGPTLRRLRPAEDLEGRPFLDIFEPLRPRGVACHADLARAAGHRLQLRFRDAPETGFKGVLHPLPDGSAVVALSFGIGIQEAVRRYGLTVADFAHTELAVEMLYLIEAKSAAMDASRALNVRLQGAMIAAAEQAFTDTLTGLKNRRALDHVLERLTGSDTPHAVMQVDLDFFKAVNDRLGHAAGDHVLQEAARILVEATRDKDVAARVGGDEFVLLFRNLCDTARLSMIAGRLIDRIETPIHYDGQECRVSASVGIAVSGGAEAPGELLARADAALYEAKRSGRAQFRIAASPEAGS